MRHAKVFLSLCAVIIMVGCSERVPVVLSTAGDAVSTTSASETSGKKIYLLPFEDVRDYKERLGRLQNGLFRSTNIVLEENAASIVTNSVRKKLEENGYAVVIASPDDSGNDAPLLVGKIVKISCCRQSFISGAVSKISIDARMTVNDQQAHTGLYEGEGSKRASFFYGKREFEAAMSGALDSAIQQLVDDVQEQGL